MRAKSKADRSRAVASIVLGVVGLALAACAGQRRQAAPCGPICITEVRRAPCCVEVWIPERCETRLAYRSIPAECRTREMPEYGLCTHTRREERVTPLTTAVEVCDYCPTLVPTYEYGCAPVMGYRSVPQYEDRIEPICKPVKTPVYRDVRVHECGCRCDECGRASWGTVGCHMEKRFAGFDCHMRKDGERLVQVNVGEGLEQVQVSQEVVCIHTGSRPGRVLTGSHYESRQVGERRECVVVDQTVGYHQTGTRREEIVKRPCRLEAHEEQVRIPGYCARVCENPAHDHAGVVMTRAEYANLTGKQIP